MKAKPLVAILLVSLMLLSGCMTGVDEIIPEPTGELPDGWDDGAKRTIASPQLIQFQTCEELEQSLKLAIENEYTTQILQAVEEIYQYNFLRGGDVFMEDSAEMATDGGTSVDMPSSDSQPREEGTDYSGTNNQEQGVDEADFVKTDGYNIYYLNGQILNIFAVPEFGEISLTSQTRIEGTPMAMLLSEDSLVVISSVNSWNIPRESEIGLAMGWDDGYSNWRVNTLTKFTAFDISNKSDIVEQRELFIEGRYSTAREVDGTVRAVTQSWMNINGMTTWLDLPEGYWNLDRDDPLRLVLRQEAGYQSILKNSEVLENLELSDILPRVFEKTDSGVITHEMSDNDCRDFSASEDGYSHGFTSIFTLDLLSENFDFEADHIVGNNPLVYASKDVMVITDTAWDWWWFWGADDMDTMTNIHTFDISNPGTTLYTGSGRVEGTILNQFSISEFEGVVRVAVTTGQWARWWMEDPEPMVSHVVTLGRQVDESGNQILSEIGRVGDIAPNETIWSARFVEDRAYIVTFENMDPLWTIDLSDPTNPEIMGELHVPGVSTYIHPLSDDMLLTIGMGPADEETGLGLDWSSTRLSTFDVSNFSNPQLAQTLTVSPVNDPEDSRWSWAYSEASYEHKAFQYWAPKGLLAIPQATYSYDYDDNSYWGRYTFVSKLILTSVNETSGSLEYYGEVNHSDFYNGDDSGWWGETSIRRSIFMGDYIYAISAGGITATNLTSLEQSAAIELDKPTYDYYTYYDYVEEEEPEDDRSDTSSDESSSDGGDDSSRVEESSEEDTEAQEEDRER